MVVPILLGPALLFVLLLFLARFTVLLLTDRNHPGPFTSGMRWATAGFMLLYAVLPFVIVGLW